MSDTNICREVGRGPKKPEEAGRPSKNRAVEGLTGLSEGLAGVSCTKA